MHSFCSFCAAIISALSSVRLFSSPGFPSVSCSSLMVRLPHIVSCLPPSSFFPKSALLLFLLCHTLSVSFLSLSLSLLLSLSAVLYFLLFSRSLFWTSLVLFVQCCFAQHLPLLLSSILFFLSAPAPCNSHSHNHCMRMKQTLHTWQEMYQIHIEPQLVDNSARTASCDAMLSLSTATHFYSSLCCWWTHAYHIP